MKKLLLLLLCVPLIGLSQVHSEESCDQLIYEAEFYNLEQRDFNTLTYSEKVARGYLPLEKELRDYFKIDDKVSLCFNDNLIGDINGDKIDDFIILINEVFLFKISNGQYFEISIDQSPDIIDNNFEGIVSLFFTNINNGKVEGIEEYMYYKERFDEWYYPLSHTNFTLQQLYQMSSNQRDLVKCDKKISYSQWASVKFISAEFIEEESYSESASGKMKLTFEEYDCSPECWPTDEKLILYYNIERGEGIYPFFRGDLEIKSSSHYSSDFIFQIRYENDTFLGIVY